MLFRSTLARAGNDFGGAVSIESAALQIRDRNALALSLATSGAASVRAGGVARLSGTITGAGNGLSLDVAGAELGALTVPGNVLIASTGAVSQTGALVAGGTTTVSAAGQTVSLSSAANQLAGKVTVTGAAVTVVDSDAALVIEFDASAAVSVETAGVLQGVRGVGRGATNPASFKSAGAAGFESLALAGSMALTAGGAVTQSGAITVGGNASVNAGANAVTLSTDANRFDAGLSVTGQAVSVRSGGARSEEPRLNSSHRT